jgi:hypothetical protein
MEILLRGQFYDGPFRDLSGVTELRRASTQHLPLIGHKICIKASGQILHKKVIAVIHDCEENSVPKVIFDAGNLCHREVAKLFKEDPIWGWRAEPEK